MYEPEIFFRKRAEEDALAKKLAEDAKRQKKQEANLKYKTHHQAEERKKHILAKMQEIETKRAKDNLKVIKIIAQYFGGKNLLMSLYS